MISSSSSLLTLSSPSLNTFSSSFSSSSLSASSSSIALLALPHLRSCASTTSSVTYSLLPRAKKLAPNARYFSCAMCATSSYMLFSLPSVAFTSPKASTMMASRKFSRIMYTRIWYVQKYITLANSMDGPTRASIWLDTVTSPSSISKLVCMASAMVLNAWICAPNSRWPMMAYPTNTTMARMKKWIRSDAATASVLVTSPMRGWKFMNLRMRATYSTMLMLISVM
mmetsp:Transcript_18541/g.46133  ORF Transcript_18541/g.46133 Transcript_18541/m.46133 type:complete len:226 (-) Transcript_18541:1542-2219(-)